MAADIQDVALAIIRRRDQGYVAYFERLSGLFRPAPHVRVLACFDPYWPDESGSGLIWL